MHTPVWSKRQFQISPPAKAQPPWILPCASYYFVFWFWYCCLNFCWPLFCSDADVCFLVFCMIRSLASDFNSNNRGWMRSFSNERERPGRERKGWMIMIYDLSGSPVASASMITPFVPSPGSDRVSRSNPGAWLILRPHGFSVSSWKPWGRLEAWRERGPIDGLGYKFELVTDSGPTSGIPIAESTMNIKRGGQFCIDSRIMRDSTLSSLLPLRGFVMGSTVEGEGKVSKPVVQVGVQHVTCMADAALFIALSAAIDLSMDACRLFSRKLRKELCHDEQDSFSWNLPTNHPIPFADFHFWCSDNQWVLAHRSKSLLVWAKKTFAYFSNFFFSLHPHFFFSSFTTLQNFLLVLFGSVASELVCEADLSADYMWVWSLKVTTSCCFLSFSWFGFFQQLIRGFFFFLSLLFKELLYV